MLNRHRWLCGQAASIFEIAIGVALACASSGCTPLKNGATSDSGMDSADSPSGTAGASGSGGPAEAGIDGQAGGAHDGGIDGPAGDGSSCTPTTRRCTNDVPDLCNGQGQWQSGARCQYGCSSGVCNPQPSMDGGVEKPPSVSVISSFASPGSRCEGLAWDGQSLWFLDNLDNVYKLNTAGKVLAQFHSALSPQDLTWDGTGLWMGTTSGLVKIDETGQVLDQRNGLYYWAKSGFAWDGQFFWVGNYNSGTIYKHGSDGKLILNWDTNFFGHPTGMTSDGASLWMAGSGEGFEDFPDLFQYSFTGELLSSFNPRTLGITLAAGSFGCLEWDGSALWYSPDNQFTVYRLQVSK